MPGSTDSTQVMRLAGQSEALMAELARALKEAGVALLDENRQRCDMRPGAMVGGGEVR
jgi:hypothetical protein